MSTDPNNKLAIQIAYDKIIFKTFKKVMLLERTQSLEDEVKGEVFLALVGGHKFAYKQVACPHATNFDDEIRCIENLLVQSNNHSVKFINYLMDDGGLDGFQPKTLLDMLTHLHVRTIKRWMTYCL